MFVVIHILDYSLIFVNGFSLILLKIGGEIFVIYANITSLCKDRGISIARLERETGLGNATIRGWETSSPTVEKLKLVADFFSVSVDELLKEDAPHAAYETRR